MSKGNGISNSQLYHVSRNPIVRKLHRGDIVRKITQGNNQRFRISRTNLFLENVHKNEHEYNLLILQK